MLKELLFKNSSVRQTVFKNTSWLFIGEIAGRLIRFSIVIYAARLLGAAEYGAFSYALSIAAFLTIFSDLGISPVITKEVARSRERVDVTLGTAVILKGLLVLVNAGILLFILPLVSRLPEANTLFPLLFFVFAFDSFRELGFAISRAFETMEREAYAKVILNMAVAGLGFAFLALAPSARSLMWAYVGGTAIGLAATVWLLRGQLQQISFSFSLMALWRFFKQALPIGLLGILGAIAINTDMIMIGWWEDAAQVGYYAAGQKIILLLYVAPTLLSSAAFPVFSRLAKSDSAYFRVIFEHILAATYLLAFPIAIGGALTAPELIDLLFGTAYAPAALTLQILFLTILVVYPSTIIPNALFAHDKQNYFLIFTAIGAFGNALLNWFFIPQFGIAGAAIATVVAQLIANAFIWMRMKQTLPFAIVGRLGRIVVATICMGVVILVLQRFNLPTVPLIAAAAAVYFGTLLMLREPMFAEIKRVYTRPESSS